MTLAQVLDDIAAVWVATTPWERVTWATTPSDSATSDRTFAFGPPTEPEVRGATATGVVRAYRVAVRLVVRPPPNDPATEMAMVLEAHGLVADVLGWGDWPAGTALVSIDPGRATYTGGPEPTDKGSIEVNTTLHVWLEESL